jgi:putative tricarboxylic transport membrane protein
MIEIWSLVFLSGLAIVLGAIVGLLPGLNPVLGLMLILPWLVSFDAHQIIIFWISYICVTQYYGSVAALWFKLPGETSSLPVLNQTKHLNSTRSILKCYRLTALSSLISSIVALILFSLIVWALQDHWYMFFSTKWLALFFILIFVLLLVSNRHKWVTVGCIALGLLLSNFEHTNMALSMCSAAEFFCFALKPTDINLALICLYGLPFVFVKDYFAPRQNINSHVLSGWKDAWKFRWISIKHSLIGFVIGFVPGMGVTLSANASAAIEARRKKSKILRTIAAAESSNNSSIISSTVPFLLLGIPITGTELILDSWFIVHKAQTINAEFLYSTVMVENFAVYYPVLLVLAVLFVNIVCFFLVSRFSKFYQSLSSIPPEIFTWIIRLSILLLLAFSISANGVGGAAVLLTLMIFGLIGIWSHKKNIDVSALPISMMVGSVAVSKIITAFYIIF